MATKINCDICVTSVSGQTKLKATEEGVFDVEISTNKVHAQNFFTIENVNVQMSKQQGDEDIYVMKLADAIDA